MPGVRSQTLDEVLAKLQAEITRQVAIVKDSQHKDARDEARTWVSALSEFKQTVQGMQSRAKRVDEEPDARIDYERGDLDDIVVQDVSLFRMERMAAGSFWIRCYCDGKQDVVFWLHAVGKITGTHQFD